MKKFAFISLMTISPVLYAGFVKNRIEELNQAKERCLADKVKCGTRVWNKLSSLIEKKINASYSYEIKPEVLVIYDEKIHTFNASNANRPLDPERSLPIHYAAEKGDVGDIKTLLAWGADINSKNRFGETPLIKATQSGNYRAISYLLENGAVITQSRRPFEHFNPFHYAVLLPKEQNEAASTVLKILHLLINNDPDRLFLNQNVRKGTPLEIAITEKLDPQIINFLLLHGAHITRKAKKDAAKLDKNYDHVKNKILNDKSMS